MHVRYVKKRLDHGSVVTDSLSAAVPLAAVTKLEVPAGRRSNWDKGARSGAIVGGLVGLGFGALLVADCGDDRGLLCPGDGGEQAKAIVVSAAVLGMAGGVLGTVIGAMSSREVWQEVPVGRPRVAVFPTPTGLAVGAAIRF
jgi:hypothetical protein